MMRVAMQGVDTHRRMRSTGRTSRASVPPEGAMATALPG
jgi:hypothetical protein